MAKSKTRGIKTFRNPTGCWEYVGAFSVELTPDADRSIVPSSAEVQGGVVRVKHGRVKQTMGGIQLYSEGEPFYWGYPRIKVIRDGDGILLWVNHDYR